MPSFQYRQKTLPLFKIVFVLLIFCILNNNICLAAEYDDEDDETFPPSLDSTGEKQKNKKNKNKWNGKNNLRVNGAIGFGMEEAETDAPAIESSIQEQATTDAPSIVSSIQSSKPLLEDSIPDGTGPPEDANPEDSALEDTELPEDSASEGSSPTEDSMAEDTVSPDDSAADDESTEDSATDDESTEDSATDDESTEDSATDDESTEDSATDDESTEDSATDDESTEDSAIDDESTEDSATVPEESATDDVPTEDLDTDDLPSEDSDTEGLAPEDSAEEETTPEQPIDDPSLVSSTEPPNVNATDDDEYYTDDDGNDEYYYTEVEYEVEERDKPDMNKPYVPPDDDFVKSEPNWGEDNSGKLSGGSAADSASSSGISTGNIQLFQNGITDNILYESPKEMINDNDSVAEIVITIVVLVFLVCCLLTCTARQMIENPDGCYASVCRVSILIYEFLTNICCFPCNMICGSSNRRTHNVLSANAEAYASDLELT